MNLDEAIAQCYQIIHNKIVEAETLKDGYEIFANDCLEDVEVHRQLVVWLNELKRARILLKATHNLFEKQMESGYVLNLLSETVFYDESECEGHCLMEDIENLLKYHV